MHRKSYAQEIGVKTSDCVVPWPYVVVLLALLAFGTWRGVGALRSRVELRQDAERIGTAAQTPTGTSLARK